MWKYIPVCENVTKSYSILYTYSSEITVIQDAVPGSLDFDKMTGVLGQVAGQMAGQMAGMRTNSSIRFEIYM